MTRKRTLARGIFGMPQAILEVVLDELTPEQRAAIDATKAQYMMEAAVSFAGTIGRIIETDYTGKKNPDAAQRAETPPPVETRKHTLGTAERVRTTPAALDPPK